MRKKNKNEFHEDSDKVIVIDELARTREYRQMRQKRIAKMKELGVPEIIIQQEEFLEKMTYTEYINWKKEEERLENLEKQEYIKNHPAKEEVAKLIWERFDSWFNKYKNDIKMLTLELDTGWSFCHAWYYGKSAPKAEKEFYEKILTEDDYWSGNYIPIFEVCDQKIKERLKQLGYTEEE